MEALRPFCVAGRWKTGSETIPVRYPYTGETIATICTGTAADLRLAAVHAADAFQKTRSLPLYERIRTLRTIAALLDERRDELIRTLILEGGKTRKVAESEVFRAIETIRISMEEAARIEGTILSLDRTAGGAGRTGYLTRVPVGPVLAITPFNYPLNLACHKIGPAIAVGAPFLLKPSTATPLSSGILAEIVLSAGYPEEAVSMIPAPGAVADTIIGDDRFGYLSFTGSPAVGWDIKNRAGKKNVGLELGGNAAAVVCADADLAYAAERIVTGGFANAGQNCVSVQRVLIEQPVYEAMADLIVSGVKNLHTGDPQDPKTDVGPMISPEAAQSTQQAIRSALAHGARLLTGGERNGAFLAPTVLTDVAPDLEIACREIFAPVLLLTPFETAQEAFRMVNQSAYGLQAGIFTDSFKTVQEAFSTIEVGALMANDVPTFRVDEMPYGGVRESGMGREGPAYTIREMTVEKMLVVNKK